MKISCIMKWMLVFSMLQWWYTQGWGMFFGKLADRLRNAADFFSLRLLVGNLFAPYRQISANGDTGQNFFQRLLDNLMSRLVGATIRIFLLIVGILAIIFQAIGGILIAVLWPLAPLIVVGCVVLTVMQVSF